jgi:hypothetical protein
MLPIPYPDTPLSQKTKIAESSSLSKHRIFAKVIGNRLVAGAGFEPATSGS